MYIYIPSLLDSLPPPCNPISLGHYRALSWAIQRLPTSYLFYTRECIYVNALSQFALRSPSPTASTCLCSPSAPLFLPWKEVHLYHFSRSHLYVLIYNICFHLFDFTVLLSHKKEWNEVFCREVDDLESVIQISCTFNGSSVYTCNYINIKPQFFFKWHFCTYWLCDLSNFFKTLWV